MLLPLQEEEGPEAVTVLLDLGMAQRLSLQEEQVAPAMLAFRTAEKGPRSFS